MQRRGLATVGLVLGALVAVACGGDAEVAPDPTITDSAIAEVSRLEPTVEVALDDDAAFAEATDRQPLDVGQVVRTDTDGFAQIDYVDGSLARLGADTTYTVTALAETDGAVSVTARLDAGELFNRVTEITESDGRYEVDTPVGTAAVRGTIFTVVCDPDGCTFAVLEGTIVITLLDGTTIVLTAGQRLLVAADGSAQEVEDVRVAVLQEDPWVQRNIAIDGPIVDDEATEATGPVELPDTCALLEASEVQAVTGFPVAAGEDESSEGSRLCHWRPEGGGDVMASGATIAAVATTSDEFDALSAGSTEPAVPVDGLGNAALLWYGDSDVGIRVLLAVQVDGGVSLRFSVPTAGPGGAEQPSRAEQERIVQELARIAVGRVGNAAVDAGT